jgi:ubiquitin carboxyl-terminal hydrolase L3
MNPLAHSLGLPPHLAFHDVYSITDDALLALVPRPVHAVIFLFPITPASEAALADDEAADGGGTVRAGAAAGEEGKGERADSPVLWFPQTIGHACGLVALVHACTNGAVARALAPSSPLAALARAAAPLSDAARAALLHDSDVLEAAHAAAAQTGDSRVPAAEEDVPYGFTAFVRGRDGRLWEMEGRRSGPVDRGVLGEGEDILSERVLGLSVYPYVNREKVSETRFSCLALVGEC